MSTGLELPVRSPPEAPGKEWAVASAPVGAPAPDKSLAYKRSVSWSLCKNTVFPQIVPKNISSTFSHVAQHMFSQMFSEHVFSLVAQKHVLFTNVLRMNMCFHILNKSTTCLVANILRHVYFWLGQHHVLYRFQHPTSAFWTCSFGHWTRVVVGGVLVMVHMIPISNLSWYLVLLLGQILSYLPLLALFSPIGLILLCSPHRKTGSLVNATFGFWLHVLLPSTSPQLFPWPRYPEFLSTHFLCPKK